MRDSPLVIKSKEFALAVIKSCKELRNARCESALINQFLRSGTSIGANIHEAFYAHGRADFIAKLQIALKECSETEYWIELLTESGYYSGEKIQYCEYTSFLFFNKIRINAITGQYTYKDMCKAAVFVDYVNQQMGSCK